MLSDLRYALRAMARNRGTTAIAAFALALGIGANTAMFSVLNAALLRPLPFKDPGRLVWIWMTNPSRNLPQAFMAYWQFDEWRRQAKSLESASAYRPGAVNLVVGSEPERVDTMWVNASFLPLLGVQPVLGRNFSPEEDRPGAARVALLNYGLWQRRFGGDRGVIGKSVLLDSQPCTVIGVLPKDFAISRDTDLYLPLASPSTRASPAGWSVGVYARLKPGATLQRAENEINGYYRQLEKDMPHIKGWQVRLWGMR
ncbi:MAG: ABC transporter permease [Acidobacteriia bacterium]|nr:ABC transporter permease [Terriglobia bacterium]